MTIRARSRSHRAAGIFGAICFAAVCGGCLDSPPVEERWTRLELISSSVDAREDFAGGTAVPLQVEARITFRELLTGFLVVDVRSSATLTGSEVDLEDDPDDDEDGLDVAREVDRILLDSTSLAVEAVPITGFDHLIRDLTVELDAAVPDAAGEIFLLVYFSADVEEVEEDGMESIIVTPTFSTERDILSAGRAIEPAAASN
jgi:hypothetical protein